ncbi:C2 domain-containing protein At1g53590-like isoform X2 [Mercurialis annua]|uniref:C2 domain-containing protein At1g53590-like isoform X2 n=1 Tax=Mercurialis annua TaxID=3986 RepID=UPI00215EC5CA|nr:C2 domain-containing protein At1g53590-like isoform X2 [Mercurialis annua]
MDCCKKKAVVQHMYLGRNPPLFTEMRVLHQCSGDDHLVMELGMNFCTADDMSAVLAVKLRRRLGFGMWTKLHMTAMHVEGKVLIGVKFLSHWPFVGRLRICFAEPPYFQMTVKPIFTHGLDVTELPGIAGWLDKLLSVAFEQTLVQPNMLVVDMEKFASPNPERWFSVDEKEPVAFIKVEVVEATDMKPSDLNGLADPYVKGQLGPYKFRTKIQRKTLAPKWLEEFKIPICSWESPNVLAIDVRDKDHFVDDSLGDCTININDLRDGQRHEMWLPLQNIKIGRLRLAITVIDENAKVGANFFEGDTLSKEEIQDSFESVSGNRDSFSSSSTADKSPRMRDNFEPINIEGQEQTGIWVHQPGSEVSQPWEPRKGKSMRLDSQTRKVPGDSFGSTNLPVSGPLNNDSSSTDENGEGKDPLNRVQRGLRKISSVFHRSSKNEDSVASNGDTIPSPYANISAVNQRKIGMNFIMEDRISGSTVVKNSDDVILSPHGSDPETPGKGNVKERAKSFLKSARGIKHVLSRKGSKKSRGDSCVVTELEIHLESDPFDGEDLSPSQVEKIPVVSCATSPGCGEDESEKNKDDTAQAGSSDLVSDSESGMKKVNVQTLERVDENAVSTSGENEPVVVIKPEPSEEKVEGDEVK